MSYFSNRSDADQLREYMTDKYLCFECGETVESGIVRYDGYSEPGRLKGLFFHPACAALMGQRLICDGFPKRRIG